MTRPSYAVVLPAIDPALAHDCISSMHSELRRHLLIVDNTVEARIAHVHRKQVGGTIESNMNLGVPVSWNEGVSYARATDSDYLVIVSQSITFGRKGGIDFLAEMDARRPPVFIGSQHGWKLCAIPTVLFDKVGVFDPIFTPGYNEEIDWMWRLHLAGFPSPRANDGRFDQVNIDAVCAGDALALKRGLVEVDFGENQAAFVRKWGSAAKAARWRLWAYPYHDENLDWTYVGPYPLKKADA